MQVLSTFYEFGWTATTITSPNDARHRRLGSRCVVFSFFRVFNSILNISLLYSGPIYVIKAWGEFGWMGMRKTGPNDASGVIWALGIFSLFFVIFVKSNDFCSYSGSIYFLQVGMDGDDHNEPKRRARHVVWALGVFFFPFFHVFNILTIYF